mgnify:CR=1 FL=1|tara:strand:+ start:1444 stop:2253 length:810 start_codon:yes stop_codon:yes gene_type:complete
MKLKLFITFLFLVLISNGPPLYAKEGNSFLDFFKIKGENCTGFRLNPKKCKKEAAGKKAKVTGKESTITSQSTTKKRNSISNFFSINGKDCAGFRLNPNKCKKAKNSNNQNGNMVLTEKNNKSFAGNNDISFYTGEFDLIDKEGDDQTSLFGIEHKNPNLFRNTFVGKFSPITGGFVTGKNSIYLYTGVEGQYNLGPVKINPSFAPGYYEKGNGKDLGDVLEFKSEVKVGFDLFENSSLGYSYSHISNNDWGEKNPGTDNQSVSFSKKF